MLWIAAILIVAGGMVAPAQAETWQGKEATKDGVPHMMSPSTPTEAPVSLQLNRLWEVGGEEDDELLFGVLTQITSDDKGNIYVLDAQLHEVMVFSSSGEYLQSIGREGEGPGEYRRPSDLFLTPEGNVAVLQRMPGKIVLLSKEGDPVGNYPMPETDGMRMFFGGRLAGDGIVLSTATMKRKDDGFDFISSLVRVDPTGKQTAKYTEREDSRSFTTMESDEKTFGRAGQVWTTDAEGRVYTSDDFDGYSINVWSTDGTLERVIEREYDHRMRSDKEKERATPRVRIRRRGGGGGDMKFKMSDWDRDIQRMYPREDGTLWVLSSHGAFDAEEGTIGTFDIFNKEGHFSNQITLLGDGDFYDDGFHFVGDRLFVVKEFRTAAEAMMGGREGEEEVAEEEPEPMSVICYGLAMIVQGSK
jgi:hypothetical protein